jgi:HlyD family secretion protein
VANYEKAKLAIPLAEHAVIEAEAAYEAAKSTLADAEKRLRETDITSPIDGVVADIKTQIGAVIQGGKTTLTGGTVLAVVLDMNELLVRAEVDESDIGRILELAPPWARPSRESSENRPADPSAALALVEHPPTITVESFRDEEFMGVIHGIKPEPESSQSGVVTYIVDVLVVSENRERLLSGMRADVSFTSEHVANVVLCPNEAIKEGSTGKLGVYVPDPDSPPADHKVKFIECRFGLDNGNYSEVREGLTEGMVVYTKLPQQDRKNKDGRG